MEKTCSRCGGKLFGHKLCRDCLRWWNNELTKAHKKSQRKKPRLLKERGNTCEVCRTNTATIVHHLEEACKGGSADDKNLQLVCRDCHKNLHVKAPRGW